MTEPWEGFWQVVSAGRQEDVVPFRNTTLAIRPEMGFSVYTRKHFIELRVRARRRPPVGWPPTESEAVTMFRAFSALGGSCSPLRSTGGLVVEHTISMASDPRLEGSTFRYAMRFEGDRLFAARALADGTEIQEEWRRLSGPGTTALSGAWESGGLEDRWLYLVTAGHYGVMRARSDRPQAPAQGDAFSDAETFALFEGFGANAGARVETAATFDHWPMIAQVAGYEVRKHETFRIKLVEPERCLLTIPPDEDPGEGWRRLD